MASAGVEVPSASLASLERSLDRTIECLVGRPQNREARALLIEARRLRSVIANWRSIPPASDVRDEMLERVRQISASVGVALPSTDQREASAGTVPGGEEESVAEALDFEPRLYTLDAAANRRAAPAPARPPTVSSPHLEAPPRLPSLLDDAPANSEDEPTQAWSHASLSAQPGTEPAGPPPAPWPMDEPPGPLASLSPRAPAESFHGGAASGPTPPQAPIALPSLPATMTAEHAVRPGTPVPRAALVSSPDGEAVAPSPRVVTYELDGEGDVLAVPRTQIKAHTVKLSDPVNPLLVALTDAYSPRADAYRTLRRKLAAIPTARVLGITSANAGEGKTVFALNLALTLRESTRSRVLVVEANLRTPIMSKMLGFETPECFTSQVQRHAEDPRAPWVVAEPLPKLHLMAIDPGTPHGPLLDPVTFSTAMERIKQAGYEYVVVDSPPVLGSADCNVISDSVDAMILTALPMKSLRREMRKAVEQLEPAPVLGVVVLEA